MCDTPLGTNALKRLPVTVDVEGVFTPARVSATPAAPCFRRPHATSASIVLILSWQRLIPLLTVLKVLSFL